MLNYILLTTFEQDNRKMLSALNWFDCLTYIKVFSYVFAFHFNLFHTHTHNSKQQMRIFDSSIRVDSWSFSFLSVVDSRGNWAICGKSSGVMSMPTPPRGTNNTPSSSAASDSVNVEVMPLVSGYIHLPFIILHRYLRRGSSELGKNAIRFSQPCFLTDFDFPMLRNPIGHCKKHAIGLFIRFFLLLFCQSPLINLLFSAVVTQT